jgi:hypothetical protein
MKRDLVLFIAFLALCVAFPGRSFAAEPGAVASSASTAAPSASSPAASASPVAKPAAAPEKTPEQLAKEKEEAEKAAKAALEAPFDQSLFFSPQDLISIAKAQKGAVDSANGNGYHGEPIPQKRQIILSGIIYRGPNDWLIWLNGHKVAPGNLLKEIVDIKVHENSVHLKWFDIGLNGVIDLTIHPHEVYDIVTGIMLPGAG